MTEPTDPSDELILDARRAGEGAERASRPLSECVAEVDSEIGRQRVTDYLDSLPFPRYESAPSSSELMIRVEADGMRTLGRFVGREFQPAK